MKEAEFYGDQSGGVDMTDVEWPAVSIEEPELVNDIGPVGRALIASALSNAELNRITGIDDFPDRGRADDDDEPQGATVAVEPSAW